MSNKQIGLYVLLVTTITIASITGIPWVAYYFKPLYKIPIDPNTATLLGSITGAWGSYIGGIIGGVGTLVAVLISTRQTSKIQEENQKELIKRERKEFGNSIAELIGRYITDTSGYRDAIKDEIRINKQILNLKNNGNEIRVNELMDKKNRLQVNRRIAVECYFILKIKLRDIKLAEELLEKLESVHYSAFYPENDVNDDFRDEIESLSDLTSTFIDSYLNDI